MKERLSAVAEDEPQTSVAVPSDFEALAKRHVVGRARLTLAEKLSEAAHLIFFGPPIVVWTLFSAVVVAATSIDWRWLPAAVLSLPLFLVSTRFFENSADEVYDISDDCVGLNTMGRVEDRPWTRYRTFRETDTAFQLIGRNTITTMPFRAFADADLAHVRAHLQRKLKRVR